MQYRWLLRALLLAGILLPLQGLAWSAQGHAVIAQAALAQLTATEQHYFKQRAQALLDNERAKKWRKPLMAFSPFAQAAVWPDSRRDMELNTLFSRFAKTAMPASLMPFADDNTKQWHYVNAQYWDTARLQLLLAPSSNGRCKVVRAGQLDTAWPALMAAYSELKTPAAQGVVLAFLAHLLADAYQPLHTLASLNGQCQSDAGGNGYCLSAQGKRRCALNLHKLWDTGFEVFQQPLEHRYHSVLFELSEVLATSAQEAAFIYSTPRWQPPNKPYTQKAVTIVQRQSAAAAQALATLLHHLYEQNNEQ